MEHLKINLYVQHFEKISIHVFHNFNGTCIIYLVHIDHEGWQTYRHTVHCPNPSEYPVHTANHRRFCWNKATNVSHVYYQSYLQYTWTLLAKLKKIKHRDIVISIKYGMDQCSKKKRYMQDSPQLASFGKKIKLGWSQNYRLAWDFIQLFWLSLLTGRVSSRSLTEPYLTCYHSTWLWPWHLDKTWFKVTIHLLPTCIFYLDIWSRN